MLKKHRLVMLPSNEKAKKGELYFINKLFISDGGYAGEISQHLYFLSDDKIEVGEWCYDIKNNLLFQAKSNYDGMSFIKKIIATTNNLSTGTHFGFKLPQPSESFISKFCEEYNKDNIIEFVNTEYEEISDNKTNDFGKNICYHQKLKVDKNNYITIKKVKDSWNREELISLLHKFRTETYLNLSTEEWIDKNL